MAGRGRGPVLVSVLSPDPIMMTWRGFGWGVVVAIAVAISWLWPRIERAPTDFDIAVTYLNDRQPELALLFFPEPPWRGVAAYRAGRYAQALREFGADETVLSLYNLGNSYAHLRDWPNAMATYERVLRFDPDHADARYNLALVRKLFEPDQAFEEPEKLPEQKPPEMEEHQVTEPQEEGERNRSQAAEARQSDTAGNTNDVDEAIDSQWAKRPKPSETTGEVGIAAAIGQTSEDRGQKHQRMVGTVDLKPRNSTRPPAVLLRRIHDDPEKVLRARMLSVYESRIAGIAE
jgi:Ca-activated chloride channel family protein